MKKREELFRDLSGCVAKIERWESVSGPGLFKKILRIFYFGMPYILNGLARLNLIHCFFKAKTFWGKQVFLPIDDRDAMTWKMFGIPGGSEYKLTRYFIKHLKEDDVFYDVGANYGFYTFLAEEFLTQGSIHAFEPIPKVFDILKNNSTNPKTVVNQCALWSTNELINFYDTSLGGATGTSSAVPGIAKLGNQILAVKAMTLDSYLEKHEFPSILKLDVEGGEVEVIKGGMHFFASKSPVVIMEVWGGQLGHQYSAPAIRLLLSLNYKPYFITKDGQLELVEEDKIIENKEDTFDNFVFKK